MHLNLNNTWETGPHSTIAQCINQANTLWCTSVNKFPALHPEFQWENVKKLVHLYRRNMKLTWVVGPFFILNAEKFTPLEPMLLTNKPSCSSSPHAQSISQLTPKPAESPQIVLATLSPAIVLIGNGSGGEERMWVFTSFKICSRSSIAT